MELQEGETAVLSWHVAEDGSGVSVRLDRDRDEQADEGGRAWRAWYVHVAGFLLAVLAFVGTVALDQQYRGVRQSWQCGAGRSFEEVTDDLSRLATFWRGQGAHFEYHLNVPTMALRLRGTVGDESAHRALVLQFRAVGGVCSVEDEISESGTERMRALWGATK